MIFLLDFFKMYLTVSILSSLRTSKPIICFVQLILSSIFVSVKSKNYFDNKLGTHPEDTEEKNGGIH